MNIRRSTNKALEAVLWFVVMLEARTQRTSLDVSSRVNLVRDVRQCLQNDGTDFTGAFGSLDN